MSNEYIEREALIKAIENDCLELVYYTKEDAIQCVKAIPAADVAPVVHSWWTEYVASAYGGFNNGDVRWWARKFYRCERCSNGSAIRSNYCPHCGAKMGDTE